MGSYTALLLDHTSPITHTSPPEGLAYLYYSQNVDSEHSAPLIHGKYSNLKSMFSMFHHIFENYLRGETSKIC